MSIIPIPPESYLKAIGSGDFYEVGQHSFDLLVKIGGLLPHHNVLEIGCGCGRIATPLTTYLDPTSTYDGFDVLEPLIVWSQENITTQFQNFRFHYANLKNTFYDRLNDHSTEATHASKYNFPFPTASLDFVLSTSVFTHLNTEDTLHYINEVNRVLKPGGIFFVTFFLINDDYSSTMKSETKPIIDFKFGGYPYWYASEQFPEWAVAYDETFVLRKIRDCGLVINNVAYGAWKSRGGLTSQDIITATKL